MQTTIAQLKIGQKGTIVDFNIDEIPMKLLEMGCLPGNSVELIQIAPFGCPLYFNVNDSHVAIRLEMAKEINVVIETKN
ncbi:MAG: FeoA family protein [Flavobacterium sp.]|uniref:FeoA family protein n=1 Tax=Flavobacterium sp. TaxID=239 RepID=UPI0022CA9CD7|nr:FeoA family protein [Flavobacterium sp.]MCZ8196367.1 FeoA family protein [Flavobacterium sp.]